MLSTIEIAALLVVLTAALGWINHVAIGLPHTIGLLLMGLAASLILVGVEVAVPDIHVYEDLGGLLRRIDFKETVLNGFLAFLLFAGALHVDVSLLRRRAWAVGSIATVGVLISTAVVGFGLWLVAGLLGLAIPLAWALVFGALISPTDPVAVLSTLKSVKVPETLELDMSGESLFNDGVGVVVFTVVVAVAAGTGETGAAEPLHIARLFFVEALGGAVLGLCTGWVAYRAMRRIDNYPLETLISIALAIGTYVAAARLHTSGPIAVVVSGILIGNRGPNDAMSELTERYVFGFWQLVDEILNSILFLLIGLEVLVLGFTRDLVPLALAAIPLALLARFVAVGGPVLALRHRQHFVAGTVPVLTWGGLRGGISIALALSLPDVPEKPALLAATYAVVVFTIVVQGLTLRAVVRRAVAPGGAE
ncbi:cation:proton antiporter [Rhodoplanes roseus]|uniref:cation:proton antiporter n=1 Tax=Rhodoplanes roseus TaxID=29409 RepID=UPI001AECEC5E|nr:sodium:proton antiporter [Rhodoplanes roseus]